ncbi:UNVERIFIED_CONTAM: hypothetical protein K2H54_041387 [Gekko kuhli]
MYEQQLHVAVFCVFVFLKKDTNLLGEVGHPFFKKSIQKIIHCKYIIYIYTYLIIFTYIQHLYTAFVLCECVSTYIFSKYYKINKKGMTQCLPQVQLVHQM